MPRSSRLSSARAATARRLWQCLLFGALHSGALAFPSGAPDSQCSSMVPGHVLAVAHSAAVYTVTASSSTYSPNQNIDVTIASEVSGVTFRGFMLQARPADNTDSFTTVGVFLADGNTNVICNQGGITHNSNPDRSTITVTWKAPDELQGNVKFRATVVKVKLEYYPEVYSDVISPSTPTTVATTTSTSATTTTALASTTTTSSPTTTTNTTTMSPSTTTTSSPPTTTTTMSPSTTTIITTSTYNTNTSPPSSSTAASDQPPTDPSTVPPTISTQDETNTNPVSGVGLACCDTLTCLLLLLLLYCLML